MLASISTEQPKRIAAIRRYDLGVGAHKAVFDGLVELASQICDCPVALVSIVRERDQHFEARLGLEVDGTGLNASICSHAILQDGIAEIPDTRLDPRTRENPLVTDEAAPMLFYAGAPIVVEGGIALGTVCVLDRRPRVLSEQERQGLRLLALQAARHLEAHELLSNQDAMRREVDHRVRNSLANVSAMTRMAARRASPEARDLLESVERRIEVMVALHDDLYRADDPDAPIDVSSYLDRIAMHLRDIAPPGVRIDMMFQPVMLIARRASALGVLLNEMISNACKHGFPDGREGLIQITGQRLSPTLYQIACSDDGLGTSGGASNSAGLGNRIMEASAALLDGTLEAGAGSHGGYRVQLEFPLFDV